MDSQIKPTYTNLTEHPLDIILTAGCQSHGKLSMLGDSQATMAHTYTGRHHVVEIQKYLEIVNTFVVKNYEMN